MALESTTRDALIAEMLGDIGRLHDSVNSLAKLLPTQTELVEIKITGLIGLLQMAGDAYKEQIKTYTNNEAAKVREQMENDLVAVQGKLEKTISDVVELALEEIKFTAKQTIKNEITAPTLKAISLLQPSNFKNVTLCLASGLISGLAVAIIIKFVI